MSTVMGLMLAAGTWIIRGSLFLKAGGLVENFVSCQIYSKLLELNIC